jgi:hypothetical protein
MNLIIRDVFVWRERRWRLIDIDPSSYAWIIDVQDHNAWTIRVARSELEGCVRDRPRRLLSASGEELAPR